MSRNTIFNFCCYALLMAAGIWAATRGEFGIAALVFFGSSMLLISRLLHGVGSVKIICQTQRLSNVIVSKIQGHQSQKPSMIL